jgi:hypothetical protein
MRAISEPRPLSFWQWLLRPRRLELRVTPMSLMGLAAAGAVALFAVTGAPTRLLGGHAPLAQGGSESSVGSTTDTIQVRFVLVAKGARTVAVAGDFNGWNPQGTVLEDADGQGTFVATVPLGKGAHEYMFLVDGRWVTDPAAGETRPDGFGRSNAILRL